MTVTGEKTTKTAVIDRTLSSGELHAQYLRKEHVTAYSEALKSCGTDYVEIRSDLLHTLEGEDLSQRYIFRAETERDLAFCRNREFAYICIPYGKPRLLRRLKGAPNVIAEICADEYSAHAVLLEMKSSGLLKYISVIRLTGFFSPDAKPMQDLIAWFRKNFVQSIDICPLNRALSGCVGAIGAAGAGADAISLTFGQDLPYTSVESYYIDSHILSRSIIPREIIEGLCGASKAYMQIFGALPCGLEQLEDLEKRIRTPICDPELGVIYRALAVRRKPEEEEPPHESAVRRKIESMDLESDLEKTVLEAVKKAGLLG